VLRALAAAAVLALALGACDEGGSGSPPTQNGGDGGSVTAEKPASVPDAAALISETVRLGTIERQANQTPQGIETRLIDASSCEMDVLIIRTARETVYAGLECTRYGPQVNDLIAGSESALVLEAPGGRQRVLIETLEGGQVEFTVTGIWVE
jgi:hypothetical protein